MGGKDRAEVREVEEVPIEHRNQKDYSESNYATEH